MYAFSYAISLCLIYVKVFSFTENRLSASTTACSHLELATDFGEKMLSEPFYISSGNVWPVILWTIFS